MSLDRAFGQANLAVYVIIWLLALLVYQIRRRRVDAGSVLLGLYVTSAILSWLLFTVDYFPFEPLTLLPFLYLFLFTLLTFLPILRFDAASIQAIASPSRFILVPFSLIFIVAALVQIPTIASGFGESVIRLLTTQTGGLDLYNEAMAESISLGDGAISNLPSIITNAYGNVGILLLFFSLAMERKRWFLIGGLALSCLIGIFQNTMLGQRGPIAETLLAFLITYVALRRWFTPRINRVITVVGVIVLLLAIVPIGYLTVSRFGDTDDGTLHSTYFYLGQQNLFFNNHGLANNGLRYGDRTVPLFKRMLGFEQVPNNFWERREKYPHLEINDEVFVGFVGDITLDFGPFVTPVLLLCLSGIVLFGTRTPNRTIGFHQLLLLHFVMTLGALGSIKLYPYSDVGGNLQLLLYMGTFIVFAIDHDLARRYRLRKEARLAASQFGDNMPRYFDQDAHHRFAVNAGPGAS